MVPVGSAEREKEREQSVSSKEREAPRFHYGVGGNFKTKRIHTIRLDEMKEVEAGIAVRRGSMRRDKGRDHMSSSITARFLRYSIMLARLGDARSK